MGNFLIDLMDRLRDSSSPDACWSIGARAFRDCGSAYLTVGTAPSHAPSSISIRSTTPEALMRDYIAQRMSLADPWMRLCAGSASPAEIAVERSASTPDENGRCRLARLFDAHGIRHAMLLPAYAGNRPGGFVIYADSADAAHAMASEHMQGRLRLLAAVLAAYYRPEIDAHQSGVAVGHYQVNDLLSAREREALKWLATGLRTAQIAARMRIEPVTVNKHFYCAIRKLKARTREQALALALRDGLLTI